MVATKTRRVKRCRPFPLPSDVGIQHCRHASTHGHLGLVAVSFGVHVSEKLCVTICLKTTLSKNSTSSEHSRSALCSSRGLCVPTARILINTTCPLPKSKKEEGGIEGMHFQRLPGAWTLFALVPFPSSRNRGPAKTLAFPSCQRVRQSASRVCLPRFPLTHLLTLSHEEAWSRTSGP